MTSETIGTDSSESAVVVSVPKQLTAAEVAEVLRVGVWTVVEMCRAGVIPASKPGKSWLIDPADLRAYLDAHSNQRQESA